MKRSVIVQLPPALRHELDRRLIASGFGEYISHAEWVARQGYHLGKSSLHRYGVRLEQKLAALAVPVEASIQGKLRAGTTRLETGVLVIVIDPVTRKTHAYAAPFGAAAIRTRIERMLLRPASGRPKPQKA